MKYATSYFWILSPFSDRTFTRWCIRRERARDLRLRPPACRDSPTLVRLSIGPRHREVRRHVANLNTTAAPPARVRFGPWAMAGANRQTRHQPHRQQCTHSRTSLRCRR